jgi:hypothetical protein
MELPAIVARRFHGAATRLWKAIAEELSLLWKGRVAVEGIEFEVH